MAEALKLEGKSGEGECQVVLEGDVIEWAQGTARQAFMPRDLPHVQLGRESLMLAVLAAAGMTAVAAYWALRQPDPDSSVWSFAAMIASVGWVYLAGAWLLQKTTLWLGNGRKTWAVVLSRFQHARAQRLAEWVVERRTAEGLKTARSAPTSLIDLLLRDVRALGADDATLRAQFVENPLAKGPLSTYPKRRRRGAVWNLMWIVAVPIAFTLAFTRMMFATPGSFAVGGFVIWTVVLRISVMAAAWLLPHFEAWLDGAE